MLLIEKLSPMCSFGKGGKSFVTIMWTRHKRMTMVGSLGSCSNYFCDVCK